MRIRFDVQRAKASKPQFGGGAIEPSLFFGVAFFECFNRNRLRESGQLSSRWKLARALQEGSGLLQGRICWSRRQRG
jgi:hypothetical protein